jgi:gag-polypeptide of LTR copia-type
VVDITEWDFLQRCTKAFLCLYIKQYIYSLIADHFALPTFKHKWDKLKNMYGSALGSTTVFNLWIQLTQARLDDTTPMAGQLAKLNETHVTLANASIGVTDTQFCLILLHALPASFEVLTSTILTSGPATDLKHSKIIARIINEEGCWARGSSSLNVAKAAPIKASSKNKANKKDHSQLTCHYCNNKGHIKPDCCKKKKDEKEKKEKEGSNKAANAHVKVESMASITEVPETELKVSLYTARKDSWMMDSGVTHHISPHALDFKTYAPIQGTICLSDKSTVAQEGVGLVVIKSQEGFKITLNNVLHVLSVKTCFISISTLEEKGAEVSFKNGKCAVLVRDKTIATGHKKAHLYWLEAQSALNAHIWSSATSLHIWDQHMGHVFYVMLKEHGVKALKGLDINGSTMAPSVCHRCEMGKSTCQPFPGSAKKMSRILEIVHSDLVGPIQIASIQKSLYIATFLNDYSCHAVVYYLKTKDQFKHVLKQFLAWFFSSLRHS